METERYLVYENWQAENKAVVHIGNCIRAREGHNRLKDYTAPNDRWFGYFHSIDSAVAFASLLPNRNLKICRTCMKDLKGNLSST
jgi:hypothetical protein